MHVVKEVLSLFSQKAVKWVTGEADREESDVFTVTFLGTSLNLIPFRHAGHRVYATESMRRAKLPKPHCILGVCAVQMSQSVR